MINEVITFGNTHDYILLQLQPEICNQDLEIKSSGSSSVLCTPDRTFQLKDVQQSNTLLFVDAKNQVNGQAKSWLEVTAIEPIFSEQLKQIPVYSPESPCEGIPTASLYASIPASTAEIGRVLRESMCIEISGKVARLDDEYICRLIHTTINAILAAGLDLENISQSAFDKAIEDEEEPSSFLNFILDRFSTNSSINATVIAQFIGIALLRRSSPKSLSQFQAEWQSSLPKAIYTTSLDLSLLSGHFVLNNNLIVPIDIENLPLDPRARLTDLMTIKPRWSREELASFLDPIQAVPNKQKAIDSILLKYTRKIKLGPETVYEKR